MPDGRGRVLAGVDNMGGSAANRLGSGSTGGITGTALNLTVSGTASGGGGAHNNVQPTLVMSVIIKL